jgi:hypothetical protein
MAIYDPDGNLTEEVAEGVQGFTSLSGVSAEGAGAVLNGAACRSNHCLVVVAGSGVSAGAIGLQGSLDGINFFDFPSASITTDTASTTSYISVANSPAQYLRAAVTTAITGGTISALVASA